jgi:transaldolase / glucose-6-phosphate isomerase
MAIEGFSQSLPGYFEQALKDARANWNGGVCTDIVSRQLADVSKFKALAAEIAEDGFQHFVLLATGASSLCAEVFRVTFGKQANAPELLVLDSTDAAQIQALRAKIDPARTLFCVSSQSGTDLETDFLLRYFFEETKQAGHHFIAVTEAGSPLEDTARQLGFRQVFRSSNQSALSDFGLVPHAAMGLDTERLLKRTTATAEPGVAMGLTLATAAMKFGRDKVTVFCSESIRGLGAWIEQLLVPGLIALNEEPIVAAEHYGEDRIFVFIRFAGDKEAEFENGSGEPVIRIVLQDLYDLGQIFLQWETAMAVAGSLLGVNPSEQHSDLTPETPILDQDGIQLFADEKLNGSRRALGGVIRCHLDRLKPGDYFGLLAYVPMFPEYEAKLQKIRKEILLAKQTATVLGFGPRFEQGAGRAYQAGPNSGVFLQITYGGGETTQARGYFQVLAEQQRRVLRIHFSKDLAGGLDHLHDLVCAAVAH